MLCAYRSNVPVSQYHFAHVDRAYLKVNSNDCTNLFLITIQYTSTLASANSILTNNYRQHNIVGLVAHEWILCKKCMCHFRRNDGLTETSYSKVLSKRTRSFFSRVSNNQKALGFHRYSAKNIRLELIINN